MKTTKTLRARPSLEGLEDRCTPATLVIHGTALADSVNVSMQGGLIKVVKNNAISFHSPVVYSDIRFYGYDGNDRFINNTNLRSVAYGMNGHDILVGGSNNDVLLGGKGNDCLYGRAGNDQLFGGDGNDRMWGGIGNDMLRGQNGNDRHDGGLGFDFIDGGANADWQVGGEVVVNVP